jgi:hypothetical protein
MGQSVLRRLTVVLAAVVCAWAGPALAASPTKVTPFQSPNPMRVFVVHDTGTPCGAD